MISAQWIKRIHGFHVFLFVGIWIAAVPTGWINSVAFVSHMSMWALVYTAVSAWQGSRTEVKQEVNADVDVTVKE